MIKKFLLDRPGEKRAQAMMDPMGGMGMEEPGGMPDVGKEEQIEKDFSTLAFMFLRDKAKPLIPFMVGFEIANMEEDGTRAAGIFGFSVSGEYYFIPVFFINGQIRGMDSVYYHKSGLFYPLIDEVVNDIVESEHFRLGDPVHDVEKLLPDMERPDFSFVSDPPGSSMASRMKMGSLAEDVEGAVGGNDVVKDMFARVMAKLAGEEFPEDPATSPLVAYLKQADPRVSLAFAEWLSESPALMKAAARFYPDIGSLLVEPKPPKPAEKAAEEQVKVIDSAYECEVEVPDEDRERLVRDGFTVLDKRDIKQKSTVVPAGDISFNNVKQPGAHGVLLRSGAVIPALVFNLVKGRKPNRNLLVYSPELDKAVEASSQSLFTAGELKAKKYTKDAIPVEDMEPHKGYIVFKDTECMDSLGLIRVSMKTEGKGQYTRFAAMRPWYGSVADGKEEWSGDFQGAFRNSEAAGIREYGPASDLDEGCEKYDIVVSNDHSELSVTGYRIVVPADWKALEVGCSAIGDEVLALGDMSDVDFFLTKSGCSKVTVEYDPNGADYYTIENGVMSKPRNYKTAFIHMVKTLGLGVEDAEEVLKTARSEYKERVWVKPGQVSVSMPTEHVPPPGYDPELGVALLNDYEQELAGTTEGAVEGDYSFNTHSNIGGQSERESVEGLAQMAEESGQRNVFDHAAIGGLSKLYDPMSAIDMFIPQLLKALDAIGRILFIFHWRNEEFTERYGDSGMADTEDLYKNVYNGLGEMVFQLKKKTVGDDTRGIML